MRALSLPCHEQHFMRLLVQSRRTFSSKNTSNVALLETPTRDGQWLLPTMIHQSSGSSCTSPPILLVAGWSGVATDWGALPKLLGGRTSRDIITYDARGMGHAIACKDESKEELLNLISLTQMAQDAMDVLSNVTAYYDRDEQSFGVGGVSMGGMVAQLVAGASLGLLKDSFLEKCTQFNVSSLMLMSTTPGGHVHCNRTEPPCPDFLRSFDDWLDHHDCPHTLEQRQRQCAQRFFSSLGDDFLRRPGRRKLQEKLIDAFVQSRSNFSTNAGTGMEAQRRAIAFEEFDARSFLPSLRIPSLLVHGENDRVMPVENAYILQELLGPEYAQLDIISNADHLLWITHGLELCDILGEFYLSLDE